MQGRAKRHSALVELVGRAVTAPSSHNTQPWRFVVRDGSIDVLADRTRALPVNDPRDRELTISCACALLNLRVAAASAGLAATVQVLPDLDCPDLIATVALGAGEQVTEDASLAAALGERRTHRAPFEPRDVDAQTVRLLAEAAEREGAFFATLDSAAARRRAAALVAEGDAAQWSDPRWRRELARWMHSRRRGDGLRVPLAPVTQIVVRSIDMGRRVGTKDGELALFSPVLAVLGTRTDEPRDWVRAGQALERVLLVAGTRGLGASYLNQPIQVEHLRPRLAELLGREGMPQLLLRLGYASSDGPRTPRRPIEDVVDLAPGSA